MQQGSPITRTGDAGWSLRRSGRRLESVKLLGGQRQRLLEAVRFFAERNPATLPTKATREIVEELLAGKKALGASTRYVQDLEAVRVRGDDVEIFTTAEFAALPAAPQEGFRPCLARH